MLTLNFFVRKKEAVSAEDFRNYWTGEHFDLQRPILSKLGIRKYTICETLHEDPVNKLLQQMYGTLSDAYDFVDQMVMNDLADFKNGLASEQVQAALQARYDSEADYVDFSRSDFWFSVDVAQIFPRTEIKATWSNIYLKVFMVGEYDPKLSLSEAQLHWNACHGGMARQFAEFLPYDKYVQGHRLESPVIEQMKNMSGISFENRPNILGQAEAWIDRRIVPSLNGPEVERMMGMLVEDIALFLDASESHMFAGKEHVMHTEPIITSPLPTLFSAD
jgi:hypothetical protein